MNPFLNPVTGLPFIKDFIFDPGRSQRYNFKQMQNYRDKVFRKIIKYAYTVPVYHKKYKKAGVHPEDIRGIKDITKLPFISKKDIIENFPNDIVPIGYNKNKAQVVCTSGSTGKPVSLYNDFPTTAKGVGILIRELRFFNLHWRKTRSVHIGNFSPNKADIATEKLLLSKVNSIINLKNHLKMNCFDPIQDIIKKLDKFQPDLIISYPSTFQQIAYFKKNGHGTNINPKILFVGGYVLDEYTRNYVEEAFGCRMLNVYASAESTVNIAFECYNGNWHIHHDFFHVEAIDENMDVIDFEKRGHIVMTRMFGKGTPFIRYTGMDDWVTLESECECECGLRTPIIKTGVEGRMSTSVILPDGRSFPAASFAILSVMLNDLKTRKVKQFQIVQKKIDEIDILLVIDDNLREEKPSVEFIIEKAKKVYKKKVGPDVKINVKEVKNIKSTPGKPSPLVISKIDKNEVLKTLKI
jgi:phenylacetate-CoA ligase